MAITGVTGFIGSTLADFYVHRNWNVYGLCRTQPKDVILWRPYDLSEPLRGDELDDCEYLIHCAYIPDDEANNLEGTRRLLELAREKGLKKIIFISSMSALPNALSHYGKQKYELEQLFSGPNEAVVRPGLVIGQGGLCQQMANFMRKKKVVPLVDGGKQPLQCIHIDDLVAAIDSIIHNDLRGTFTVAENEPVPYREFYAELASRIGVNVKFIPVNSALLNAGISAFGAVGVNLPISKENVLGLKNLKAQDTTADLQTLGVTVRDYKEALEGLF